MLLRFLSISSTILIVLGCSYDVVSPQSTWQADFVWEFSPSVQASLKCGQGYAGQHNAQGAEQCKSNALCNQLQSQSTSGDVTTFNYICIKNGQSGQQVLQMSVKCASSWGTIAGLVNPSKVPCPDGQCSQYIVAAEAPCSCFDYGVIFIIIVFVGLFIYFVGGFAFNFGVRKLRGVEAIPNVAFWKDLPYLVKDGFFFVFGRFCGRSSFTSVK